MDVTQANPVLRRKLGVRAPAGGPVDPAEARHLPRALARATSRIPGLVGSCSAPARRTATLAELLELIEDDAFVALIADEDGAVGLTAFDPVTTVALIEALTIGRLARKAPPNRRATPTDALLLSDLIDATLVEYDTHAAEAGQAARLGFRFQRFPTDYRLLELQLEASRFDLVVQPLSLLGNDVRRDGQFLLALPKMPADEAAAPDLSHAAHRRARTAEARPEGWARALEAQVMAAPAQLTAVLGRLTLPLSEVMALGVGSRLTLPLAKLEEVEMQALDGQVLGLGRLGQYRAMRAIRLVELGTPATDADPDFEDHAVTGRLAPTVADAPGLPSPTPVEAVAKPALKT